MNLDGIEFEKWKAPVNLMAKLMKVSTVVVTRYDKPFIEVLVSSNMPGNPIQEGTRLKEDNIYCDTTVSRNKELHISDARKEPKWEGSPLVSMGLIAYLGLPLLLPDGKVFGTVCILDKKENAFDEDFRILLRQLKDLIEAQLKLVYRKNQVVQRNLDLEVIQKDLISLSRELKEKNESLEDFVNFVSHDLKEPLRKIKFFSGQIRNENGAEEKQEKLARVVDAAERMEKLIDSFLELSKINTNGIQFERTDLNSLVAEVVRHLETMFSRNQISVEVGTLPEVEAHPIYLSQMFQNLLVNATKFKKEGQPGEVKISSTGRPDGVHEIRLEDNGRGFEMKYSEKIFEPLKKLNNHREKEGSGLGLAIVKKVVECHGGTIRAESVPDQGAAFIITLPASQLG